jgi:adenylosuccinate synthase
MCNLLADMVEDDVIADPYLFMFFLIKEEWVKKNVQLEDSTFHNIINLMNEDGRFQLKSQYEGSLTDIEKAYNRNCERLKRIKKEISKDMVDLDELMAKTTQILAEDSQAVQNLPKSVDKEKD